MIKKALLEESGWLPAWQPRAPIGSQDKSINNLMHNQKQASDIKASTPIMPKKSDQEEALQPAWDELKNQVKNCTRCGLYQQRTNTVFGVGDQNPDILLVGEGPGAEEDKQGEPFVGQAGKLLDTIFANLGISRKKGLYIANAVKCRPPENRKPTDEEMSACFPYLETQIRWLSPKIIIALGATGAQTLLKTDTKIGALRGKLHYYGSIPLIATYHPAYLLRSPMEKAKVWQDMVFALRTLKNRQEDNSSE